MSDLDSVLEDCQAIEAAGLRLDYKLVATSAVASMRYLRNLASELGKPLEDVTRDEIIEAFKAEQARHPEPGA